MSLSGVNWRGARLLWKGGTASSGERKQGLAIAKGKLRNPNVLIFGVQPFSPSSHSFLIFIHLFLDEATSALDATSRILVSEALKR
jgi:hypothetical protein